MLKSRIGVQERLIFLKHLNEIVRWSVRIVVSLQRSGSFSKTVTNKVSVFGFNCAGVTIPPGSAYYYRKFDGHNFRGMHRELCTISQSLRLSLYTSSVSSHAIIYQLCLLYAQSLGILEPSLFTTIANGTDITFGGCTREGFDNLVEIVLVIYQLCEFPWPNKPFEI